MSGTSTFSSLYNPELKLEQPLRPLIYTTTPVDPNKVGVFALIFVLLVEAMQIRQGTVLNEAQDITLNSNEQQALNLEDSKISYVSLPSNPDSAEINRVQIENQERSAARANLQNDLVTARQDGQVMMTQTSTNVDLLQQNASEDSGWLQTLNTLYEVINELSPAGH